MPTKTQCSVCGQTHDKCVGVVIYLCPEHHHLIEALEAKPAEFCDVLEAYCDANWGGGVTYSYTTPVPDSWLNAPVPRPMGSTHTPSENPDD